MGRATIDDVAKMAGVSIKTVSRVVNREPNVRPATRAKVDRAIEALNYRPSTSARSLAGRRSFLVGLLYVNPAAGYITNILTGAIAASRKEGFDLLLHPCEYTDPTLADEITALVANHRLDGIILTPPLSDMESLVGAVDAVGTPLVRIAPGDQDEPARSVYTNDLAICAEMTRYIASLGHRQIGFLVGHPDQRAVQLRYAGFLHGMGELGLPVDGSLVCHGDNSFASGQDCARTLLRRTPRPTAIIASTDDMAAGVMRVAHEMGLRIPQDLSVTGFDDVALARQIWPALTTIRQPMQAMGDTATELLLARVLGRGEPEDPHTIPSEIVIRESTGPAPDGEVDGDG